MLTIQRNETISNETEHGSIVATRQLQKTDVERSLNDFVDPLEHLC
jgi:hypothetical protein